MFVDSTPWQVFKDLVQTVGWATVIGFAAWAIRFAYKAGILTHDSRQQATKAMEQINHMATNCFPTMQKNLEAQTKLLESNLEKQDKGYEILANIDKNIAILKDRGDRL